MTYDSNTGPLLTPSPTCSVYAPHLPLLNTGELTDEQAAATREHLASCAFCRNRLAEYDTLYAALRSRFDPDVVAAGVRIPAASEFARLSGGPSSGGRTRGGGSLPPRLADPDEGASRARGYVALRRLPRWVEAVAAILLISLLGGVLLWQHGSGPGGPAPLDAQERAYVAILNNYYRPLLNAQGTEARQCVTAFDSSPAQLQAMVACRPLEVTAQTDSQTLLDHLQAASTPPRWKDADTQLKAWAQATIDYYTARIQAIDAQDVTTFKQLGDAGDGSSADSCVPIEQIDADLPAGSGFPPNASGYCGT